MSGLTAKERMAIPRAKMPEQAPEARIQNFREVPNGLTKEQAKLEAARCLDCKNPACVQGCPVGIDIPGFIKQIEQGEFNGAAKKLRETNFLPAICGRVCPQDQQCEAVCIVGKKHEPVGIGMLERFASDYERDNGLREVPQAAPATGKKVAVVGSGPAGLTAAYEMAVRGHDVTVFEAFHRGGGVLVYGIPRFRLPMDVIDEDLGFLAKMGVKFEYNVIVGKSVTLDELKNQFGFDVIFLGTGAGLPKMLGVDGENLNGVYSANEYLTRVYLMGANEFPKNPTPVMTGTRVGVIGAGNTAMDAARTARRMGADVTVYYRRTKEEAPARTEELEHAEQEGVKFRFLVSPVKFIGNDEFFVTGIRCEEMELSEPDDSGRRKPVATGKLFEVPVDTIIFSLGCDVNPLIPESNPELKLNKWGVVVADPATGATSIEGVYAGGDIITGGSKVITAMGQAKVAAQAMHDYVMRAAVNA